jgi:glycosyltransferase involved in cell wall biosynthesis
VHAIGHGIDVNEFACADRSNRAGVRALVLGRYSPAKGIETILRAVDEVDGVEVELHGAALNELERRHREELQLLGHELGDAVPRAQIPELFDRSDVLVNNMRAGAPDKVVYEAAAACLPVLASNPVFDELFDGYPLTFDRESPGSLAERLRWFASLSDDERAAIGRTLRERVARHHSVDTWADGIIEAAS